MNTGLVSRHTAASVLYRGLILAACCCWLGFAVYLWNTGAQGFPRIPWLDRLLFRTYSMNQTVYILCSVVPFFAWLLLRLIQEAKRFAPGAFVGEQLRLPYCVAAWCLVGFTLFLGLFASALPTRHAGFRAVAGRFLSDGMQRAFAAYYVYIGAVSLALLVALALLRLIRWIIRATSDAWLAQLRILLACGGIAFAMTAASILALTVADAFGISLYL